MLRVNMFSIKRRASIRFGSQMAIRNLKLSFPMERLLVIELIGMRMDKKKNMAQQKACGPSGMKMG